MKTLMAILVGVGLVALCSNASAATVLPDEVLGELYAAARLDINDDIKVVDSALASQSNIAAIGGGDIYGSSIYNSNYAYVYNYGNSAVALQSNIGVAGSGGSANVDITNINTATVDSDVKSLFNREMHAIQGMSVEARDSGCSLEINELDDELVHSAVALQSNIAAICAEGLVSGSNIVNTNTATVTNNHF